MMILSDFPHKRTCLVSTFTFYSKCVVYFELSSSSTFLFDKLRVFRCQNIIRDNKNKSSLSGARACAPTCLHTSRSQTLPQPYTYAENMRTGRGLATQDNATLIINHVITSHYNRRWLWHKLRQRHACPSL